MSQEAYDEFSRDWSEAIPYLKGLDRDSVHSAPFVAIRDVIADESVMWEQISQCDVNRHWSACIGSIPGRGLRAYFCELAYTQANLHANAADSADWPDTGLEVVPGWWKGALADFEAQIRLHCPACGIAMRRPGKPAVSDPAAAEEFSHTHRHIARPKSKGRLVEMVESIGTVRRPERPATEYLDGTTPKVRA